MHWELSSFMQRATSSGHRCPHQILIIMATVKTSTTAQAFDSTQVVRRSTAAVIKRLDGTKIDRFVKHTDLVGAWEGADESKAYSGLVPVIGGTERFDLALLTFDLMPLKSIFASERSVTL